MKNIYRYTISPLIRQKGLCTAQRPSVCPFLCAYMAARKIVLPVTPGQQPKLLRCQPLSQFHSIYIDAYGTSFRLLKAIRSCSL